ncbi:hypothetical protein COCVIDRAFT_12559 [Bipolaris victoriae FI3]|uniref:Uncharacterized protein n=1 Tax=Bipolaris victoriae (strain FI3) TaxID=930091 RepID=W7F5R7_BIPV3|nr:hypothetical protein COCVIDRAFT_12559 [Bipolaris victoriae FI3]
MADTKKSKFSLPPLIAKVQSLLPRKQDDSPMFNHPFDTNSCPHHRIARKIYGASLLALFITAILVMTLKAITYSFVEDNRMTGFVFDPDTTSSTNGNIIMAALPRMLHTLPTKLAIIIAAISLSLATGHLALVIIDWKSGKRTQSNAFRRNTMFIHIVNAILVLFALVAIYTTHTNSSTYRPTYISELTANSTSTTPTIASPSDPVFRYDRGTFDLETWACSLKSVEGAGMVRDDYAKQCSIETAGRAVMVPFLIAAWIVAGVSVWGFVGGGRRGPNGERMSTDEVGVEMGKMNATDE